MSDADEWWLWPERSWPFMTPEGFFGWRYLTRENSLFELIFVQPPWRGSPLLHLVGDERPN